MQIDMTRKGIEEILNGKCLPRLNPMCQLCIKRMTAKAETIDGNIEKENQNEPY